MKEQGIKHNTVLGLGKQKETVKLPRNLIIMMW